MTGPEQDAASGATSEPDAAPEQSAAAEQSAAPADGAGGPRFRVRPVIRPPRPEQTAGPAADRVASRDETDEGWGDVPARRDADWYARQRPPHHG